MSENIVVIPVQPENEQSVMVADVPSIYEYQRVLAQTVTAKDEAEISKINAEAYKNSARVYSENAKNYAENINVYTPAMTGTVLSWSNLMGKQNPASVDLKGPKGDAFTYADFTAEQLARLKGPKGDDAVPAAEVQQIEANKQSIIGQSTKITALEQELEQVRKYAKGILWDNSTDDSVAHTKSMPSGAKMGSLELLGGRSVVVNQLFEYIANATSNGGVWSYDNTTKEVSFNDANLEDGKVSNSYALNQGNITVTSGHKYFVWSNKTIAGINIACWNGTNYTLAGLNTILTCISTISNPILRCVNTTYTKISGVHKFKINLIDLTQMFGSGNEPSLATCQQMFTEYIPYNTGELVSIKTTGLSVRGRNLWNSTYANKTLDADNNLSSWVYSNGVTSVELVNVQPSTQYTYSVDLDFTISSINVVEYDSQGVAITKTIKYNQNYYTFTTNANTRSIRVYLYRGSAMAITDVKRTQLEYGSTSHAYSPYTTPTTITLPTTLQVEKSAGNIADTVEIYEQEGKWYAKKTQRVGSVQIKDLNWFAYNQASWVNCGIFGTTISGKQAGYANAISPHFTNTGNSKPFTFNQAIAGEFTGHPTLANVYFDYGTTSATANEFKTTYGEDYIYYELATPIITTTEITEPIDFECEGNGSVTFENSSNSNVGVPSTLEYIIALNEV